MRNLMDNGEARLLYMGEWVRINQDAHRDDPKLEEFLENAKVERWAWLVTGETEDGEEIIIQPAYMEHENNRKIIKLGEELRVYSNEVENIQGTIHLYNGIYVS